ncbi:hypothetical protein [Oceanibaculum sp.]|uniref:hypothetical protein n=1 Tax=Oceanibaculum sp. TaxID=1903597 RepID=UPI00258EF8A0|nr:hypothetical protein [Oceanibaculum sp.]MCH2394827.1 hypothetical protein [Oceanibaculum sp.]
MRSSGSLPVSSILKRLQHDIGAGGQQRLRIGAMVRGHHDLAGETGRAADLQQRRLGIFVADALDVHRDGRNDPLRAGRRTSCRIDLHDSQGIGR